MVPHLMRRTWALRPGVHQFEPQSTRVAEDLQRRDKPTPAPLPVGASGDVGYGMIGEREQGVLGSRLRTHGRAALLGALGAQIARPEVLRSPHHGLSLVLRVAGDKPGIPTQAGIQ
jgi:hypothetical protein